MQRRSYIVEISRCVHPRDDPTKTFLMLQAYMDESGIHTGPEGAPICVFGGFVASVQPWRIFESKWKTVLLREGLVDTQQRPDFHAKLLYRRRSVFRNWTNAQRHNFENELLKIIYDSNLVPVAAAIHTDDFFRFSLDDRRLLTGGELRGKKWVKSGKPNAPYFMLFQSCILKAAKLSRSKIHFVFDQQKEYEPWAKELFDYMRIESDEKNRLGDRVFSERQEALGIQAADLLLYGLYDYRRETAELLPNGIKAAKSFSLAMMIRKYHRNLVLYTRESLQEVLSKHKSRKGLPV